MKIQHADGTIEEIELPKFQEKPELIDKIICDNGDIVQYLGNGTYKTIIPKEVMREAVKNAIEYLNETTN